MLPRAGVRGILGGVRAPAPLEAAVQRSSPAISTGRRRRATRERGSAPLGGLRPPENSALNHCPAIGPRRRPRRRRRL